MRVTLKFLCVLCVWATMFVGCAGQAEGQPTAHLACFDREGRPWLRCTIRNNGASAVVLESEQLLPQIAVELFDCDGRPAPGPLDPFPLGPAERSYVVLAKGEKKVVEFPADLFRRTGECRLIRGNYHPSSYPEVLARGAVRNNICSDAFILQEDGICAPYQLAE
jgi:hypothetical protein